ncbi:MAG: thioredoxin family protein [Flavobacteriia bacterium]|nr:thioredoxin family protein [Flavobacteriia bacterium]
MKKLARYTFSLVLALFTATAIQAQIYDPVEWDWSMEYTEDGNVKLLFTPSIEDHWHIYSLNVEGGPLPTEFEFEDNAKVEWLGDIQESEPIVEFDKSFDTELAYHEEGAYFYRIIKVKEATTVKGTLSFMVCNDEMCLPPEWIDFEIDVKPKSTSTNSGSTTQNKPQIEEKPQDNSTVDEVIEEDTAVAVAEEDVTDIEAMPETETAEVSETKEIEEAPVSIWGIFAEGFGWGLAALFMPCIFPMIPLTVSFFTKQSKTKSEGVRKAIIYGLSINVIYVSLGILITILFGSDTLNAMATNPYFNLAFFALFVVFAISFFGAFEITLPSKWVNKAENASNRGGMIGIFFMAFTLALVSFSCTGPLIGTLLVNASTKGEILGPAMGMLGFSLALSLPFMLFAAFPGWMNSLPKSGGWLNTVKVTLGFVELGFAMKFASTADLVWQAHWLERELFLAIWVGIAIVLALYLFGAFRMPHDSPVERIGVGRMLVGLFFMIFAFYTLPGVFGAPVKLLAGFPPPQHYAESPDGGAYGGKSAKGESDMTFDWGEACPPGIDCFNDFEEGLKYAKHVDKPVMLDFTGWGCVNCRKMEEQVWVDEGVMARLNNDVVLVSLYVDERTELPESEQYESEVLKKTVKTIGLKWSDFQASNFGNNSQPYYVILNHESLEPLNGHAAYDPDIPKFKNWIDEGVRIFQAGI